jgi:hypothetical protein
MLEQADSLSRLKRNNIKHYLEEMALAQKSLNDCDPKKMYNKEREEKMENADRYEKVLPAVLKMHHDMIKHATSCDFDGPTTLL